MFETIKNMLGLASMSPIKLGMIIVILSMIGGGIVWYDTSRFNAGYNKAEAKYLKEAKRAREQADANSRASLAALTLELTTTKQEANKNKNRAVELQSLLDNRPTLEIIREIETIQTGECVDLGSDYQRLFNDIIGEVPDITSK